MTPQDRARLMQGLMEHEGWKEYERSMREYVWNMIGATDPQFLAGVKHAIQVPKQIVLAAEEMKRRA
ncbi:MAG: hypothetical protein EPN22_17260 [Nitrospirae bacterium]|nr:MAG: hypothetical protein EPN22_17260 [Nitrospirota bacterium]